jgi:hypothetical protein
MLRVSRRHALATLLLFAVEVYIGACVRDRFVRPFLGDVLVVMLLYCGLASFLRVTPWKLAAAVLAFAWVVEVLQYFDYVALLGLERHRLLSIVMGRTFQVTDLLAYTGGAVLVVLLERCLGRRLPGMGV